MRMDPELAKTAYRIGGVIGRGALAETPVLDHAPYLDLIPVANIHESVRPFTVRARLLAHTGQKDTQPIRSEEHTSELQSLMRISYAVFCLKKKKPTQQT